MAVGEDKYDIFAVFHQNFSKFFKVVSIFRGHDALAVIEDKQNISFTQLFNNFWCIFNKSLIKFYLRSFKQLEIENLINFIDILASTELKIDNSVFEWISKLQVSYKLPN